MSYYQDAVLAWSLTAFWASEGLPFGLWLPGFNAQNKQNMKLKPSRTCLKEHVKMST
jgi:hypothetical protein